MKYCSNSWIWWPPLAFMDSRWCLLASRSSWFASFTYGYDANTRGQEQLSSQSLYSHAQTLISNLALEREATEVSGSAFQWWRVLTKAQDRGRPIIFVAHSLGGMVLKNVSLQKVIYLWSMSRWASLSQKNMLALMRLSWLLEKHIVLWQLGYSFLKFEVWRCIFFTLLFYLLSGLPLLRAPFPQLMRS